VAPQCGALPTASSIVTVRAEQWAPKRRRINSAHGFALEHVHPDPQRGVQVQPLAPDAGPLRRFSARSSASPSGRTWVVPVTPVSPPPRRPASVVGDGVIVEQIGATWTGAPSFRVWTSWTNVYVDETPGGARLHFRIEALLPSSWSSEPPRTARRREGPADCRVKHRVIALRGQPRAG